MLCLFFKIVQQLATQYFKLLWVRVGLMQQSGQSLCRDCLGNAHLPGVTQPGRSVTALQLRVFEPPPRAGSEVQNPGVFVCVMLQTWKWPGSVAHLP